jgi:hypothetical protein
MVSVLHIKHANILCVKQTQIQCFGDDPVTGQRKGTGRQGRRVAHEMVTVSSSKVKSRTERYRKCTARAVQ